MLVQIAVSRLAVGNKPIFLIVLVKKFNKLMLKK
jgi:hypothetical protein